MEAGWNLTLPYEVLFTQDANKRQELVHLLEIQDRVVVELYETRTLTVERCLLLTRLRLRRQPVNVRKIDHDVDHIAAKPGGVEKLEKSQKLDVKGLTLELLLKKFN